MERVLEKIVAASRRELALRKTAVPAAELERKLDGLPPVRDFRAALTAPGMQVIAELKAASPSKGIIRQPLEVEALAVELERSGAAALSVLTERNYFLGGLENLERARKVVELPLLRKDFIYDEYQILEARAAGADAVLLIAAMLAPAEYRRLQKFAESLGLAVLSEAHTAGEIAMLLDNGASIVGVNARNLSTFATDLGVVAELMGRIPADKVRVSESALKSNADLKQMKRLGADAFLIGETLMRRRERSYANSLQSENLRSDPAARCRAGGRTGRGVCRFRAGPRFAAACAAGAAAGTDPLPAGARPPGRGVRE